MQVDFHFLTEINRYRRICTKVDAIIFDSALSHTRRSDVSEKRRKYSRQLWCKFACGQVSSPRLYRLSVWIASKSSLQYFQDTGSLQLAYVGGRPNKEVMLFNIKEWVKDIWIVFIMKQIYFRSYLYIIYDINHITIFQEALWRWSLWVVQYIRYGNRYCYWNVGRAWSGCKFNNWK